MTPPDDLLHNDLDEHRIVLHVQSLAPIQVRLGDEAGAASGDVHLGSWPLEGGRVWVWPELLLHMVALT